MSKKVFALLLAGAFVLAGILAGCAKQDKQGQGEQQTTSKPPAQIQNVKFLSGPTGTTWYAQASAFSGIASKNLGMTVDVLTGSAISNVIQVENGKADIGLTFSSYLPAMAGGKVVAKIGETEYFKEPLKNVRTLCYTTTAAYVLLVDADSPYETVEDLKGKPVKYVTYPSGFTARYVPEKILEAHGITHKSIEDAKGKVIIVGKYEEACDLLAKGQADVIAYTMALNAQSSALSELEAQKEFKILKLNEDAIADLVKEIPVSIDTVPKGLHKSIKEDTKVLADVTTWVVRKDIPEDTVDKILSCLLENMDAMAQVGNSEFKGFTAKDLARLYGKGKQLPLHPGAEKFYKEKGAI
ncbi:MAG: TAXI family TRAP transporter solute-binding subunit [Armatimonadetes bacterium]|nr:TAXI family TRAP transporter solute-binding subunit [Armatimonadota bacterium]